ncbi:GGDEF domain-containing protein [Geothrix oryzisoli]|uniref:GGDEF domain-containing protein n=1 Tax=Geothrix oryzisoli TaxID=2922721 RepID=UPI001FAD37A6|nr:GGDEF domain-containing protein [Geothrix oryzisoli]
MTRKRPASPPPPPAPVTADMPTMAGILAGGDDPVAPSEWALVAYAGAALGRIFPLRPGASLIGRAPDVQVALLDGEVSRHHARIGLIGGQVWLEDLGSTNGTQVNGVPADGVVALRAGDRLTFGGHVLKLVAMDPLERAFHETLLDLSTKDPLTGLANRTRTLSEFQTRFGLSVRYGRPLSVLMCDLDHFKVINDTHGHGAGDFVLQVFGERLRATLREPDLAGRIGGEEFLVILPETDLNGAKPFAERLRKAIAAATVPLPGCDLEVTCSLGVAERQPGDLEAGQMLARADAGLYRAKVEGRNRVCVG